MQDLISRLYGRRRKLSELENRVFEYILRNPKAIENMTADELANRLYISTATVSRTAKHLGFKGFQELKYAMKQYTEMIKGEAGASSDRSDFRKLSQTMESHLHQTFELLAQEPVEQIVEMMMKAETIEVFGLGGSMPICIDVARKLTFLGKKANARMDWDEQQAVSLSLTPNDLAIMISNSGETISIMEYATNLEKNQVPILAITGNKGSSLEKLASHTLHAIVDTIYYDDVDLSSRVSLTAVFDVLLIQIAEKRK